jgi:glycosyltransferase involved in cell wall biosynthesis
MTARRPQLSVVVPVFNEAGNVVPLGKEIRAAIERIGRPFEIIFVNDGSQDATLEQLCGWLQDEAALRVLDLDGNFGEAAALCAGFQAARGELVITLDGDGQNDPRDIPGLLQELEDGGLRVVSGWRQRRHEGFVLRVLPSRIANRLIALITRLPVHDNGCGLKVYRREVVQEAQLPRGFNRFTPAIFGVGQSEVGEVSVNDRRRQHGESHYGISRTLVVLRDLLALPFIIANARLAEALWALTTIAAAVATAYGLLGSTPWLAGVAAFVAVLGAMIWWNVHRFNRAQRNGVFRVRREYSFGEAEPLARRA